MLWSAQGSRSLRNTSPTGIHLWIDHYRFSSPITGCAFCSALANFAYCPSMIIDSSHHSIDFVYHWTAKPICKRLRRRICRANNLVVEWRCLRGLCFGWNNCCYRLWLGLLSADHCSLEGTFESMLAPSWADVRVSDAPLTLPYILYTYEVYDAYVSSNSAWEVWETWPFGDVSFCSREQLNLALHLRQERWIFRSCTIHCHGYIEGGTLHLKTSRWASKIACWCGRVEGQHLYVQSVIYFV